MTLLHGGIWIFFVCWDVCLCATVCEAAAAETSGETLHTNCDHYVWRSSLKCLFILPVFKSLLSDLMFGLGNLSLCSELHSVSAETTRTLNTGTLRIWPLWKSCLHDAIENHQKALDRNRF